MPINDEKTPQVKEGICPSCGKATQFDLIGIQHWPEAVAKKSGLPREQSMWQCRNCETTLMDTSLPSSAHAS